MLSMVGFEPNGEALEVGRGSPRRSPAPLPLPSLYLQIWGLYLIGKQFLVPVNGRIKHRLVVCNKNRRQSETITYIH